MTSATSLYEIKEPIRTPNSVSHRSSTTIDRKAVGGPVDVGSSASRSRKITLSSGTPVGAATVSSIISTSTNSSNTSSSSSAQYYMRFNSHNSLISSSGPGGNSSNNTSHSTMVPPHPCKLDRSMSEPADSSRSASITNGHHHHNGNHHNNNNNNNNNGVGSCSSSSSSGSSSSLSQINSNKYKTELCRSYDESRQCKYGEKCRYAHGTTELRTPARHPKYKTEPCRTYHSSGFCPYGPRCHFIHNENERKTSSGGAAFGANSRPKLISYNSSPPSLGSTGDSPPPSSVSERLSSNLSALERLAMSSSHNVGDELALATSRLSPNVPGTPTTPPPLSYETVLQHETYENSFHPFNAFSLTGQDFTSGTGSFTSTGQSSYRMFYQTINDPSATTHISSNSSSSSSLSSSSTYDGFYGLGPPEKPFAASRMPIWTDLEV
ncbi:mRNA decay activator protein ZFP36L2 [Octopus bimaculoides]|uniref:mRNA decay activator protein ZFP36L2 n=1 Tax=Octopus bimaculoides TaxID=37653 RepID=UPI00071C7E33|nr:mRNA decay activator protein ZFP36L2 [Octopus bimaculoides]|eukprot:XP_014790533.1 PREDICTED: zinc finger protein 36, C3H1 type-like 2 [Octopus bimaculoides]